MAVTDLARVLLVDDHAVVRQGLRFLIEMEGDMTVVSEAETAAHALESPRTHGRSGDRRQRITPSEPLQ